MNHKERRETLFSLRSLWSVLSYEMVNFRSPTVEVTITLL